MECLTSGSFAQDLLAAANKEHKFNPAAKEMEACRSKISSLDGQLSLLAERLVSLPASISPAPIYAQMEKLQKMKSEAERALAEISAQRMVIDPPAELKDFQLFLATLKGWLKKSDKPHIRARIVRTLIKKIVVSETSVDMHFFVGESYVQIFLGEMNSKKRKAMGVDKVAAADSGAENECR